MSFESDIQGKNTQLYPVVKIGEDYYSTNNTTIKEQNGAGSSVTKYCKPILMNIPSIKESVDVESRKFKISNVSLQFNNFPFEGVRFSDQLSETSLINTDVKIFFKSQSTDNHNLVDVFHTNTGKQMQLVYQGIVRRISHDDEKVKIELEDLTEQKAHKDLPQAIDQNGVVGYLGDDDSVPDKYKLKPIPMVYGHVDRSPVVISKKISLDVDDESEYVSTLDIDSKELLGFQSSYYYIGDKVFSKSPLYINESDAYINIKQKSTIGDVNNFVLPDSNTIQFPTVSDSDFAVNGEVTVEVPRTIKKLTHSGNTFSSSAPELFMDIVGIVNDTEVPLTNYGDTEDEGALTLATDENESTSVQLTGLVSDTHGQYYNFQFHLDDAPYDYECDTYLAVKIDALSGNEAYWMILSGHSNEKINIDSTGLSTSDYDSYSGAALDSGRLLDDWDYVGAYNGFSIQVPKHIDHTYFQLEEQFDVKLRIVEAHIYHIAIIPNLIKNDFYANVRGRINTFDNHPDEIIIFQSYSDEELVQYVSDNWDEMLPIFEELFTEEQVPMIEAWVGYYLEGIEFGLEPNLFIFISNALGISYDDRFLQNPIDIIYDLVRSELGHDKIDEAEYAEAKLAHADWKFGFTVNKKTSSKKLIQDIAKSTKCFPKFKNDGSFGFNTIKDSYTYEEDNSDYAGATPIKESEVISYSFKKTKPEQIYKKVTVSYNKDYAQDSYLKTASSEDLGADSYYGIEDSADAHLEFESDYIRHKETAHLLASFLLEQYKNDHLIFNLKLPLQYIDLEIGDLVKFESLFQGVAAYGIDYTDTTDVNGQFRYPLFMITSTTKNLDSVSIECMQLHHLEESYDLPVSTVEGDVNLDGGQSILDIVQMVNYTMGDLDFNQQQLENADMNNDSIINILDIVQLVNAILD